MNTLILWLRVQTFVVLSAAVFGLSLPGFGQTLQNFGLGSLATGGSRPMLVVLADFASMCHEISHSLGAYDLYSGSCLSYKVTLMSCTISFPEDPAIYHLDPWHKLVFGWSEPRLRSLRNGGAEDIPAAQFGRADAPLLLFDPAKGSGDFFLIDYRAPNPPGGSGYDANVSGTGMVIWHITTGQTVATEGSPTLNRGGNTPWPDDAITPSLLWANGTTTGTRLKSFDRLDGTITVEWMIDWEVWVDFAYQFTERGTFLFPFNTFVEGQNAVPVGGTVWIKSGTSSETVSTSKPMTLRAYNGPVSIGRLL